MKPLTTVPTRTFLVRHRILHWNSRRERGHMETWHVITIANEKRLRLPGITLHMKEDRVQRSVSLCPLCRYRPCLAFQRFGPIGYLANLRPACHILLTLGYSYLKTRNVVVPVQAHLEDCKGVLGCITCDISWLGGGQVRILHSEDFYLAQRANGVCTEKKCIGSQDRGVGGQIFTIALVTATHTQNSSAGRKEKGI